MKIEKAILWYSGAVGLLSFLAFLSNPLNAISALLAGVGLIAIALGIRYVMLRSPHIGWWLMLAFLTLVIIGLGYRASMTWWSVFVGQAPKVIAASTITGIVLCSAWLFSYLFNNNRSSTK